jgi:hypothetical protein
LLERPCFFSESLMCSYCRSRFEPHASGMCRTSLRVCWAANACPKRARSIRGERYSTGWFCTLCSVA